MKNLIQPLPGQSRALAFGLSWHTILGENLDEVAVKQAKRKGATHYTRGGSRSTVNGLLTLTRSDRKTYARMSLFSAAAAFARSQPRGVVAIRWGVPNGIWVAAADEGIVLTTTDVIYKSETEAQEALEKLRSKYPDIVVYGDDEKDKPLSPQELTDQIDGAIELKRASHAFEKIPLPIWVVIAVIVGWFLFDKAWQWHENREEERLRISSQAIQVDPVNAWNEALAFWARSIPIQTTTDFKALLASISEVPVLAGRWELVEIDCNPASFSCSAQYERTHLGDNLALINALPSSWELNFPNLHNAVVSWKVEGMQSQSLALPMLPLDEQLKTTWSTLYQRLTPALTDISLSNSMRPEINSPIQNRTDGRPENIPFPKSNRLAYPLVRDIVLTGPLRSLYAFDFPNSASFIQLHIRRSPTTQADISNSALVATLTGKIYAK